MTNLRAVADARELIKAQGIVKHEPIPAKEGGLSPLYTDVKSMYGNPTHLRILASGIWGLLELCPNCVAAGGLGGLPLAAAISVMYNVPLTLVREHPKGHGRGGVIEGFEPAQGDLVAIVDDKVVSGEAIARITSFMESRRARVCGVYVVVDTRPKMKQEAIKSLVFLSDLSSTE